MNTPYFYIIEFLPTGQYYAGVRYANNCNPRELLLKHGYKTSSKVVHNLIDIYGLTSFKIRKIKTFSCIHDAINYEYKFLIKVNTSNNTKFLNLTASGVKGLHPDTFKTIMNEKYGVDHPSQLHDHLYKVKITSLLKYGVPHPFSAKEIIEKRKATCKDLYGTEYPSQNLIIKEKIRNTNKERYGNSNFLLTKRFKEKSKITMLKKYGVEYYAQSEISKSMKSINQIGEKHHKFSGYFVTPFGTFGSATNAANNIKYANRKAIYRWCKHSTDYVTKVSYVNNKFLQINYNEDIIGKTFKELGFDFITDL